MAKKCIPGVICIENMTLALLFMIILVLGYLYYTLMKNGETKDKVIIITQPNPISQMSSLATRNDVLNDPYAPPLKTNDLYYPPNGGDIRGSIPINMRTRGFETNYSQVGILTRQNSDLILPLMGRQIMNGRDKWQYYTMSNTGNLNTKLPISLSGKSCTSEYGCDNINNNDMVYVEGYKDTFRVTMYENNLFRYTPLDI